MKNIIIAEYVINLLILLFYYMHMFQLNSYFYKKQIHWIKDNYIKIIKQILEITLPTLILIFNNNVAYILSVLLLAVLIFYNFPKKKAKISLKLTNRVKRMFMTEIVLILIFLILNINQNVILIKLYILTIISPIIMLIANFINSPIEYLGKK